MVDEGWYVPNDGRLFIRLPSLPEIRASQAIDAMILSRPNDVKTNQRSLHSGTLKRANIAHSGGESLRTGVCSIINRKHNERPESKSNPGP